MSLVVIGASNMDLKARPFATLVPATSNPGVTALAPGGVARNIAENAARYGASVTLASIVGDDALGAEVRATTAKAGVDVGLVQTGPHPTGTYTALLDEGGDLVAAIADMAGIDHFDPGPVLAVLGAAAPGSLVVLDGNLAAPTLAQLIAAAAGRMHRILLDPVSVPKAERLSPVLSLSRPLFAITPNRDELAALTGLPTRSDAEIDAAAAELRSRGVSWVWVRLGESGSLLIGPGRRIALPPYPTRVVDVTGAGDAMLGVACAALVEGRALEDAARLGQAAAALTIGSTQTVVHDLDRPTLEGIVDAHAH